MKCTCRDPLTTIFVVGHLSSSLPRPTGLNLSGAKNSSFTRVVVIYVFLTGLNFILQSCGSPVEGCHKFIFLIVLLSQTKCTCTCVLRLGLLMAHSIPSFPFPQPATRGFKPSVPSSMLLLAKNCQGAGDVHAGPIEGTPLYNPQTCVSPPRVWLLRHFGLKRNLDFALFGLESSLVFRGTKGVYECICRFNRDLKHRQRNGQR